MLRQLRQQSETRIRGKSRQIEADANKTTTTVETLRYDTANEDRHVCGNLAARIIPSNIKLLFTSEIWAPICALKHGWKVQRRPTALHLRAAAVAGVSADGARIFKAALAQYGMSCIVVHRLRLGFVIQRAEIRDRRWRCVLLFFQFWVR